MAINLTTKYSPLIEQRFKAASITDGWAGKKFNWDGSQSIIVYSINPVTVGDYSRTASPSTGSRFGTIAELGDTVQTMQMTKDRAFTFSIDAGNAADQMNIKSCNEQLKSNWDEVVTPEIDTYRLKTWANGAGQGTVGSALTAATFVTALMTANAALSNKFVPKIGRVVFVGETVFIKCKLSSEVQAAQSLNGKVLTTGSVGMLDNCDIVPVPDSEMPTGVSFIIKYKNCTADPLKLKVLRVQKDPLGIDGDVGECRFYHDAFVLDQKVNGIYVYATASVLPAPTLTNTDNVITFACANSTGVKYTVDGSNPKTSSTATTVLVADYTTGAPTLTAGQTLRAYAYATTGYLNSAISETVYA